MKCLQNFNKKFLFTAIYKIHIKRTKLFSLFNYTLSTLMFDITIFCTSYLMIIFSFLNIALFLGETLSVESQNSTENKVDDQCNFIVNF